MIKQSKLRHYTLSVILIIWLFCFCIWMYIYTSYILCTWERSGTTIRHLLLHHTMICSIQSLGGIYLGICNTNNSLIFIEEILIIIWFSFRANINYLFGNFNIYSKEEALNSIVYSYKYGFSGFAAMLTEAQAKKISGKLIA